MGSKKRKGVAPSSRTGFEYELVRLFRAAFPNVSEEDIYRVWRSGSAKKRHLTGSADPVKEGDVFVRLPCLEHPFLVEAKHHRSSRKTERTFAIPKSDLDKIRKEALDAKCRPVYAVKFKQEKGKGRGRWKSEKVVGVGRNQIHLILPLDTFVSILQEVMKKRPRVSKRDLLALRAISKRMLEDNE